MNAIEYSTVSRSDIKISRVCFGTWQAAGWEGSDDRNFKRILRDAIEHGINFIDTAEGYGNGHSEKLVGDAISQYRESLIIGTKFSYKNSSPEKLRNSLHGSLKRLKTDYIDIYHQHWPPTSPPLEETITELERLQKEGKIRVIAVSNWMQPEWEEIQNPERIGVLQGNYSLLWRSLDPFVLPFCIKEKISVTAYSPLCQGLLSGRFNSLSILPSDVRRENLLFGKEELTRIAPLLDLLFLLSKKYGKSPAQISLRWILDQIGIDAVIVGMTNLDQLKENLGIFGWHLDPSDHQRLSEFSAPLSSKLQPHDTPWRWHSRSRK